MKIHEAVGHGKHCEMRDVDIEPTLAGLVDLLSSSRANHIDTIPDLGADERVARLWRDLQTKGEGHLGWAHYLVLD